MLSPDAENSNNVSRSGRVRKKSSKLADFQSPEEPLLVKSTPAPHQTSRRSNSGKRELSSSGHVFEDNSEGDSDMESLNLEADLDIDLDQFDFNFDDMSELDMESGGESSDYGSNRTHIIKKPDNLPQVQSASPKISPFLLWAKQTKPQILRENPSLGPPTLRIKLAQMWNTVPKAEKLTWGKKAKSLLQKSNRLSKSPGGSRSLLSPDLTSPPPPSSLSRGEGGGAKLPADVEPINIASHLKLLGESLSVIGERLTEHEGQIAVSGSISVLLDSLLCAMGPLVCLTTRVPELNGAEPETLSRILDNVAYIMPGL
eukprot:TRINITY_DN2785_c0_g1_i1.p1 TRINITY_DN2785_c0_g1~~TRINITY_DN2785_c0_g1_i1.p1  ORF type:complete len:315 (-),score=89.05 TRINITY_DN2785_c0_g1_i1:144-1088(-)